MVIGIVGATAFSDENSALLKKGETMEISGFTLENKGNQRVEGKNFVADALLVSVRRGGVEELQMKPQKRFYTGHGSATTEASLATYGFSQLYVSVGDTNDEGQTVLRAWWKSQVLLVWIGPIIMGFGGLLSLTDRRMRVGIPKRAKRPEQPANA